ncbi:MAG: DUF1573 domain-containing protein [Bacteroidota bacterium]
MKKLFFLMAFVALANVGHGQQVTAAAAPTAPKADFAVFETSSLNHDFGKIKQGTPVTHEFTFTNKGKVPLVITNVAPSCGCTTPDWTRDPIAPGGQGFIKATFNAAAPGAFNKSVTVTTNIEAGFVQLFIKGEVATDIP